MKIGVYTFTEGHKPEDLKKKIHDLKKDKRRLKNIINYAIDNERPLEQIEALEGLL